MGLTYPLLCDQQGTVWKQYGMGHVPHNVVIDEAMIVRYTNFGYDEPALIKVIEKYLPGGEQLAIYVPRDYPTIQEAIDAADDGYKIFVAPGRYDISTTIVNDHVNNLQLIGSHLEDGGYLCIINSAVNPGTYVALRFQGVANCKITGFEVRNAHSGITLDSCQNCLITKNYIHHNDQAGSWHGNGIEIFNSRRIDITYCLLDSNEFHGIALDNADSINISNNTILRTYRYDGIVFNNNSNHITVKNNIIAYNQQEGIETAGCRPEVFEHDYNCFWQNGGAGPIRDYAIGPHSFIADPLFVDLANRNYFLKSKSPCLGSGEKGIDIGAFGINPVPFTQIMTGDIVADNEIFKGHSWADYDNDGDDDLFIAAIYSKNRLYRNNGDETFAKISDPANPIVNDDGFSFASSWGDYDNDTDLDLFVTNWGKANFLYQNNGDGTFTRIEDPNNPVVNDVAHSTGGSWIDYDNDSYLDLFVTNYDEANALYHNNGDGTFTKITTGDIVTDQGFGESCAPADYDNDGYVDLFVANRAGTNALYHNNGDGTFTKITSGDIVTDNANFHAGSWGDYDNDGFLDLYVIKETKNLLYHNNGDGTFTKIVDPNNPLINDNVSGSDACWGDFDNDGDQDLFITNFIRYWDENNRLYINNGDATFTRLDDQKRSAIKSGRVCASGNWVDYNNDGFLDLFVTSSPCLLYLNNGNRNNWINIRCRGTVSNAAAIGATVRVKALINGKPVWQIQQISSQNGYCSQSSLNREFGLGDATIIDSIKINWPSGIVDVIVNQPVNQFLTIIESTTTINDDTRGDQYQPVVATAGNGSFVTAWIDERDGRSDIYAQLFNNRGEKIGNNFKVNDSSWKASTVELELMDLAMMADGTFVITWENQDLKKIFAQRYDHQANRIGNNFEISDGSQPAIAISPNGLYVIVFRSGYPIKGKRYTSLQDTLGNEFTVSHIMEYHRNPDVAIAADGSFTVVWEAEVSMGVTRIYAQRFDAAGNAIGKNYRVDDDPGYQTKSTPAIAITQTGSMLIVWSDIRQDDQGIFAQQYDNQGNAVGVNFKINDSFASKPPRAPAISVDKRDQFVVVWEDFRNGKADIYAQRLSSHGAPIGSNFQVYNIIKSNDQAAPDLVVRELVTYFVWQEKRIPGQGWDIVQQTITKKSKKIYVPLNYVSIQAAINAATDGDTIMVAEGKYPISAPILNDRVNYLQLIGSRQENGSNASVIEPGTNPGTFNCLVFKGVSNCRIEGFEITKGVAGIVLDSCQSCVVTKNFIHENDELAAWHGEGIGIFHCDQIDITYNIIDWHEFHGIEVNYGNKNINIINNTIVRVGFDVIALSGPYCDHITIKNNIIAYSNEEGIELVNLVPPSPVNFINDYNCIYWNTKGPIKSPYTLGPHTIDADPMIVDIVKHNYYLQPGSPCLGAGENGKNIGALGISTTGISENIYELPNNFKLSQNYPNPFNPITNINYQLPQTCHVVINIYNTLGQKIRILVNEDKSAGHYIAHWDGRDDNGNQVVSGVYLYQIQAGGFVCTKKMAILK